MKRHYEMQHVVTLAETNLVGNVYFSNYFVWQGRCRELFLMQHAPQALQGLQSGELRLVTAHASCDFSDEFAAFDKVCIRMTLNRFIPFGVSLGFEYGLQPIDGSSGSSRFEPTARGRQDIKFLRRDGSGWALFEVPDYLMQALIPYE